MKYFFIFLLLISINFSLYSKVYWRDFLFSSNSVNSSLNYKFLEEYLRLDEVFVDPLEINNFSTEIKVSNAEMPFYLLYNILAKFNPNPLLSDGSSMILSFELSKNLIRRYLIVNMGYNFPAVVFSIDLPKKLQTVSTFPRVFPVINGAILEKIIKFPKRNSIYCTFKNSNNIDETLNQVYQQLSAKNFQNLGNEIMSNPNSRSGLFINFQSNQTFFISFDKFSNGLMFIKSGPKN